MNIEQNQVRELMLRMGQECPDRPTMPSAAVRKQRIEFMAEELMELCNAFNAELKIADGEVEVLIVERIPGEGTDLVEAYDAVIDEIVFSIGTAVSMGTILQPGIDEVNWSNNTKDSNGTGKWVKGERYRPPNLQRVLQQQLIK